MAYIGRQNLGGAYRQLDDISSGFDGSDTTHTMQVNSQNVTVGDVNQIILSLGGVIQKPGTDFTVSGSTLTFTTAPAANTSFFAILLGSDNGGTTTPTDGSVTGDKVASSGAFTIGAAGTASSIAGLPIYVDSTNNSVYTFDVSGTDDSAQNNTAFGLNAADAITTADSVTVFGRNAGSAITTASSSTFFGKEAGVAVTEGTNNVLMGVNAGHSLTTGGSNIAIGATALDGCDTEGNNVAIGRDALGGSIAGGEFNVCLGNNTGAAVTSGDSNVFVGHKAGIANTEGAYNVFMGGSYASFAGASNTTGSYNIGIGTDAYDAADTETNNIAIGFAALGGSIAGGEYNLAIGNLSADALTSGDENVFLGYNSGSGLSTGSDNTCVGAGSGLSLTTGSSNVLIGKNAGTAGSPFGALSDHSNHMVLGHNNITNAGIKVALTVTSDGRDKTDIEPFEMGLDFINQLNPVTYRWDMRSNYANKTPDGTHKKPELSAGLIAQDVEKLEREYGYKVEDKTSVITYVSSDGDYSLTYEKFIPVLINAVQELSAKVKELEEA